MAELEKMQVYSALGVSLSRQKYGPLDVSNVFYSLVDLNWYLSFSSTNPEGLGNKYTHTDAIPDSFKAYPYEGQIVAVASNGTVTAYIIGAEKSVPDPVTGLYFDYREVGSGSSSQGDGATIDIVNSQIKIKGFGEGYWKYIEAEEDVPAHYEYISGEWKEGLQLLVHKIEGTSNYEVGWYEPNPSAVEGLANRLLVVENSVTDLTSLTTTHSSEISALQTAQEEVETVVTRLDGPASTTDSVKQQISNALTIADIAARNYANTAEANAIADAATKYVPKNGTDSLMTELEHTKLAGIATGAQVNVIEAIKINGIQLSIDSTDKSVAIPIATTNGVYGLVKGSTGDNFISVITGGVMEVNSLNVNKLVQTIDEWLTLNGGDAASTWDT